MHHTVRYCRRPMPHRRTGAWLLALPTALAACGGGVHTTATSTAATAAAPVPATTYTVGGGLSGLSGQGLTLANAQDVASPNPDDLSFVFATGLAPGTAYDVTVQLQPEGQVCAITAGSGTIGAANVTDVQVNCSAALFSIGGTISGLSATGLVLANGSINVTPPAGATTFTFPTQVPTSTPYAVTITTQPVGQTCEVTNGAGVVLTSSIANVTVTCS